MTVEVVLPKVDMDMESGVIAAWRVAEGDFVRQGDILFEMETNKALMEVESPGSGTIRGLASVTGEALAVGTAVAWIDDDSPARTESGRRNDRDSEAAVEALRATPLARHTAKAQHIDLAHVKGSGPRGRVEAKDVAALAGPKRIAFTPVRRMVAQQLSESMRAAPHFYLTAQVEMRALQAALREVGVETALAVGSRPSMTVLFACIVGRVLIEHPLVNASVDGDAILLHDGAHIGIAMDRDGELLVPVLRDANARTLAELTKEYRRLRDAVRARTVTPAEMRGGTFTISNLGMYGVDQFTAIIHPPQSAILAIGRTVDTPVGRDGEIVLRPMATLSLSSDHRVVDGITAARFMSDLRAALENPRDWLWKV